MWPEVAEAVGGAAGLALVHNCVQSGKKTIPYDQGRIFIATCNRIILSDYTNFGYTPEGDQFAAIAETASYDIKLLVGDSQAPTQEASPSNIAQLCDHTANTFEKIAELMTNKLQFLKNSQAGSDIVAASVLRLWEEYGSAIDTDSAKLFALHLHKFNVQAVGKVFEDVPQKMRETAKYFRELAAKSRELEEDESDAVE